MLGDACGTRERGCLQDNRRPRAKRSVGGVDPARQECLPSRAMPPKTTMRRARLEKLLTAMRGKRVVIVGDAMLDVYLRGDVERISPEAPVPVVRVRERRYALGGAANVAQNVAAAGAIGTLVGAVGRDEAGARLREMLARLSADACAVIETDRPTTTKTRLVARSQQVVRFDDEEDGDLSEGECTNLLQRVKQLLASAQALVLEDYNKGVLVSPVIEG